MAADEREDPGQYYPGGKIVPKQPVRPSGGGAVDSVNGKTGVVVLGAEDVGALPAKERVGGGYDLTEIADLNLPSETYVNGEKPILEGDVTDDLDTADDGKVAQAKAVGEALADKLDKDGGEDVVLNVEEVRASNSMGAPSVEGDEIFVSTEDFSGYKTSTGLDLQAEIESVRSDIADKLDKSGGTMTGDLILDYMCLKFGAEHEVYAAIGDTSDQVAFVASNGATARLNVTNGNIVVADESGNLPDEVKTTLFAGAVITSASTELTNMACSVVPFADGMTITFAASTGLRQCEVLITGCTAGAALNVTATKLRGDADALTLEAGDNHLTFAEYATGEFFVTRHLANEIA